MDNAHKEQIKELYMWWNGWGFSFEKVPKLTNIDDEESSGMDEAVDCLDDFGVEVPTDQQEYGQQRDDFIERFDSLAVSMAVTVNQDSNLSSSAGSSRVPQPTTVSSFAPGPSHTHSVDQQDIIIPDISPPREEEISRNRKGKGKEKAVDITIDIQADIQSKKAVAEGRPRRRPKKTAI